jgi:hypothetical protein
MLAVAEGCSSSDKPPPGSSSGAVPPPTPPGPTPPPNAVDGGDGGSSAVPLGDLPTVDEPNIPCTSTTAIPVSLFGAGDSGLGGPPVTNVQPLGGGRFASGVDLDGFITFDLTGSSPNLVSATLGSAGDTFASEGSTIGGFGIGGGAVTYQRYAANGTPSGSAVSLASGLTPSPGKIWSASGEGESLAIVQVGATLQAVGVTSAGTAAGAAFTIEAAAPSANVFLLRDSSAFVIVYSFETTAGGNATKARFARATTTALMGAPTDLFGAGESVSVAGVATTSAGYVLLFDGGGDDKIYAVPLDSSGKVSGVAHRLLGADYPRSASGNGGESVGIVSMSNDTMTGPMEGPRKPQFRALDKTGKPLAPWVCLDAPVPANQYQDLGVLAESNGWSVVYKTPADGTSLIRLNATGTAGP